MTHRRHVLAAGLAGLTTLLPMRRAAATMALVCPPCGCAMDGRSFTHPGRCPACGMALVPARAPAPSFEPQTLIPGSGAFLIRGGAGREAARIRVDYHIPARRAADAPVLLVLPGAGRNADDYRDAWIETSERKGVLIAALGYPEADYDFAAYQMGGVIRNLRFPAPPPGPDGREPTSVHLRDEDIRFDLEPNRAAWIFSDFDRIGAHFARAAGTSRRDYDLFGHSAGAQVLHRLALFGAQGRSGRIVAANCGLYTLPDLETPQPFGLKGVGLGERDLRDALARPLIIMLGERDSDGERGGIQLHTPTADRLGLDRLSRGRRFFAAGQAQAQALGADFAWRLEVVPGVGHEQRGMAHAAADLLYGA